MLSAHKTSLLRSRHLLRKQLPSLWRFYLERWSRSSRNLKNMENDPNFDNTDGSVDGIVCTVQKTLNKFCPIIEVNCWHDNRKHKPCLRIKIWTLIKEKTNCIICISGNLCLMVTSKELFELSSIIWRKCKKTFL